MKIQTVVLDPGHAGKQNLGYGGYYESEGNLAFGLYLRDELESRGIKVFMTKTLGSQDPSLTVRGQTGPATKADLFLSIHSDASGKRDLRGMHAIRSVNRPDNDEFGMDLCGIAANAMEIPLRASRVVWSRESSTRPGFDHYTVIDNSANYQKLMARRNAVNRYQWDCPLSYLWERGYHTNPLDVAKLRSLENNQTVAKAVGAFISGQSMQEDIFDMQIGTVVNITSSLRVRSEPNTSSQILDNLNNGELIVVLRPGTWHQIKWGSGVAYVHSDYVKLGVVDTGTSEADRLKILDLEQKLAQANSTLTRTKNELAASKSALSTSNKSLSIIGAGIKEAAKH